jgi:hypothetical protein
MASSGSQQPRSKSSPRRSDSTRKSPAAQTKAKNETGKQENGGTEKNGQPESVISLTSAVIGALAAAATLIVVPGSIALYFQLRNAGLPANLGIVASLPTQFLVATGATYVLFPLLIVIAAAIVVVLVPGRDDETNTVLRPLKGEGGWLETDEQGRRINKANGGSWAAVILFLSVGTVALTLALEGTWPPTWHWLLIWHHFPTLAVVFVMGVVCLLVNIPVAQKWRPNADALSAVILSATLAGLVFTPWAIWFAANRGRLPIATVCTTQGEHFAGRFVGETSDRVYVGNPAVRILAIVPARTAKALTKLPLDSYGIRFASLLKKRRLLGNDLAIVDFDRTSLRRTIPRHFPVLAEFRRLTQKNYQVAKRVGIEPKNVIAEKTLENHPRNSVAAFRKRSRLLITRKRTIASIPTSQVARISIGGPGSCPPRPRSLTGS